jgi:hypothetical protein
MAVERAVTFDIRADISDMKAQLEKLPEIGKEEAQKMIRNLTRTVNKATREQAKLINQTKQLAEKMQKVRTASEKIFGGIVGDVLDVRDGFLALSNKMQLVSLAAGGVGVAALGAVAGVTALSGAVAGIAIAAQKAGKAAEETINELRGFAEFSDIAMGQEAAIRSFNDELEAFGKVAKASAVILFTEFAPGLDRVAFLGLKFALVIKDSVKYISEFYDVVAITASVALEQFQNGVSALSPTLGALVGIARSAAAAMGVDVASSLEAAENATASYDQRAAQLLATERSLEVARGAATGALNTKTEATKKATEEADKLNKKLKEQQQYETELSEIRAKAALEEMDLLSALDEQIDANMTAINEAQATTAERSKETAKTVAASIASSVGEMTSLLAGLADESFQKSTSKIEELRQQLKDSGKSLTEDERANIKHRIRAEKEAAKIAFGQRKAMAISTAIINGALAVVSALTLPPPAGQIAAVAAGAATAASIAKIAAEKPKFHTGRAPDEMPATLTKGEAVLDPRSARAIGAQGIRDMNRGIGGGQPQEIRISIAGRELDASVARVSRAGGRLQKRIDKGRTVGQVNPYAKD